MQWFLLIFDPHSKYFTLPTIFARTATDFFKIPGVMFFSRIVLVCYWNDNVIVIVKLLALIILQEVLMFPLHENVILLGIESWISYISSNPISDIRYVGILNISFRIHSDLVYISYVPQEEELVKILVSQDMK